MNRSALLFLCSALTLSACFSKSDDDDDDDDWGDDDGGDDADDAGGGSGGGSGSGGSGGGTDAGPPLGASVAGTLEAHDDGDVVLSSDIQGTVASCTECTWGFDAYLSDFDAYGFITLTAISQGSFQVYWEDTLYLGRGERISAGYVRFYADVSTSGGTYGYQGRILY